MIMIMNFFGHYHDHYENYSDVTEKRQIIDLEGIFSPTDKRKLREHVKQNHYHNISDTYVSQYAASQK